jgi:hypothetical protein
VTPCATTVVLSRRGVSSPNKSSGESTLNAMYYLDLPLLLIISIGGKFSSVPERRVFCYSQVAANSTVRVWPCTLNTNPVVCKDQVA